MIYCPSPNTRSGSGIVATKGKTKEEKGRQKKRWRGEEGKEEGGGGGREALHSTRTADVFESEHFIGYKIYNIILTLDKTYYLDT
jgi:hypothetical protein